MKKTILQILIVMFLLLCLTPSIVLAQDATAEETTYSVTVTALNNNRRLSNVAVMITQNGETITYETTNRNGIATFNLKDGTYTAVVGYTSGNYSYYGTTEFTVNGADTTVTVNVDSEFSKDAAKEIYDETSYYDHVDIRVNGTFTTGTAGNTITHNITLKNVELLVVNGNTTLIDTYFEDDTETYEWRVTGKRIPNTAKVSLIFDILMDGQTVREKFTYSFEGEEDFIQAIINCDQNQGLDFIIDPIEIIEAVFYDVSYEWTGIPEGLVIPPATTTDYAPNDSHTIDTQWQEGYYVIDEENGVMYTFLGWKEWSEATDSHTTKNDVDSTTLTITNDTIIYGKWETETLEYTESHIVITKGFTGNAGSIPDNLYFTVADPNNYVVEIPYSAFKNGSYSLPVYAEGDYIIEEHNVAIPGFSFESATIDTNLTTKAITTTSITVTVDLQYATPVTYSTTSTLVDTISFINTYTKKIGENVYNYPSFVIEKADAENRNALSGAIFTLTPEDTNKNPIVSSETNQSGYTIFKNIQEGTYTLTETKAPEGYYIDETEHTVIVSLKDGSPTEQYSVEQDAYIMVYDYVLTITPSEHYNANMQRLIVYNEKITGSLTISKNFGEDSDFNKDNFNSEINITVTGDNDYKETVILNNDNNWTVTLNDLALGKYVINENLEDANISGYDLEVSYVSNTNETTEAIEVNLSILSPEEVITITNTYTEIEKEPEEPNTPDDTDVPDEPEDTDVPDDTDKTEDTDVPDEPEDTDVPDDTDKTEDTDVPDDTDKTEDTDVPDDTDKPEDTNTPENTDDTENNDIPATGDESNLYLYFITMLLGIVGFICTTLKYSKKD